MSFGGGNTSTGVSAHVHDNNTGEEICVGSYIFNNDNYKMSPRCLFFLMLKKL